MGSISQSARSRVVSKVLAILFGVLFVTSVSAQYAADFGTTRASSRLQLSRSAPLNPANDPPLPARPTRPVTAGGSARRASATAQAATSLPLLAGRLEGAATVLPTGEASYRIPIWTPPGARGLTPSLSATYVSGANDSLLGPGWSLTGLSTITRCISTYAQDGLPAAISMTSADKFCLDGKRLRVTSGATTYGQPGSTYQTEIADFSLITASSGTAGSGPASFTVRGKDGLIYEYGATSDSRIFGVVDAFGTPDTTPYLWALDKVSDRIGNNMSIQYVTSNGSYAPKYILYTQTPSKSTTYHYKIEFGYTTRTVGNTINNYWGGGLAQQTSVLESIAVSNDGNLARLYSFGYDTSPVTGRVRLNSVGYCSSQYCIQPTTIMYQDGALGIAAPGTSAGIAPTSSPRSVDVDGDGKLDLVYPVASGATERWYVKFAAGSFTTPVDTQIVEPTGTPVLLDDFLGSGRTDLLAASGGNWYVLHWAGNGPIHGFTWTPTTTAANVAPVTSADVNGDGLPDLIWADPATNYIYTRLNSASSGSLSFATTSLLMYTRLTSAVSGIYGDNSLPASSVHKIDFNGDGLGDVALTLASESGQGIVHSMTSLISSRNPTPVLAELRITSPIPSHGASANIGVPINWNNDACTDWAYWDTVAIAPCNGNAPNVVTIPASASNKIVAAVDWDADGRSDILYVGTSGNWIVGRATGTSSTPASADTGISATTYPNLIPTDVNGDGLDDLVAASANYATANLGLHNGAQTPPDLATIFTDGFAVTADFDYVSLGSAPGIYFPYTDSSFPDVDYRGPRYVAAASGVMDGGGTAYTQDYYYYGARMNVQGRGFAGFDQQRILDSRNSQNRYLTYSRTFPSTGLLLRDKLLQSDNATVIHDLVNTLATPAQMTLDGTTYNQRYFPYVSRSVNTENEVGGIANGQPITATTTTYGYDGYGNMTSSSTAVQDTDANSPWNTQTWTTSVSNTYVNDASANWCIGLISQDATTQTANSTSVTRTTAYTRDTNAALCRNSQQIDEPNIPLQKITTTYGFDTCGNINIIDTVGTNPDGTAMPVRVSRLDFADRCQSPETVINASSERTAYTYDYTQGVVKTVVDPNNLTTRFDYDDFGRLQRKTDPTGQYSLYTLYSCNTPPCWGVNDLRFSMYEDVWAPGDPDHPGGKLYSTGYYWDGFNRQRYKQSVHAGGTLAYDAIYGYDMLGNKAWQYVPVISGSNGYTSYTYDPMNRVLAENLYDSGGVFYRSTGYQYAGRQVIVTDPMGSNRTQYINVAGQLGRAVDPSPGGTTDYTYEPFGNLTQVSDAAGNISTWTYNSRGFRVATTDADRGAWTFTVDSLGQLRSQKDAKTQTTSYSYDLVGRLVSRTEAEGTSTWVWGNSPSSQNVGRLQSMSGPDGYSEAYTYGNSGRPMTTTFTADTTYTITWNYWLGANALRDVTFPALPGSPALHLMFGFGGSEQALTSVYDYDDTSKVYWQLLATDARGNASHEKLLNGVHVYSTYDPMTGHLVNRYSGTSSTFSEQQSNSYIYDKNENLTDRIDRNRGNFVEHFTYDPLNRLTYSTLTGVSGHTLDVGFDPTGNISSKSDVGTYTYDTVHKHAVASTSNGWNFTYDANGNMKTGRGATINWTSYNLPGSITNGTVSSSFAYTPDRRYWKQVAQYANGTATTISLGGMLEKVVGATTEYRHYIRAGNVTLVIIRSTGANNNTYYVTQDQISSSAVVTGSAGAVVVSESFTPYGARRGSNWTDSPSATDYSNIASTTRRGFTSHTMLDNLSLIHMNGRVYDNVLGRFLSPDPYVNDTVNSQAFSPYSYVYNSPLNAWDPTGYGCTSGVGYGSDGMGEVAICGPESDPPTFSPPTLTPIPFDSGSIIPAGLNLVLPADDDEQETVTITGHCPKESLLNTAVRAGPATALAPLTLTAVVLGSIFLSGSAPESQRKQPQFVIRGGEAKPDNLIKGSVPVDPPYKPLTGFSVTSAPGMSVEQLAQAAQYKNGKISYTTTDALKSIGVPVIATPFPERGMPLHATAQVPIPLDPARAAEISAVFKQMQNPAKCGNQPRQ